MTEIEERYFFYETQIVISNDNRLYAWRTRSLLHDPAQCVGQRDRNAMFWECVTYSGVGTLVPISGNMNSESEKYIGTLDQNLCPSCFAKC